MTVTEPHEQKWRVSVFVCVASIMNGAHTALEDTIKELFGRKSAASF